MFHLACQVNLFFRVSWSECNNSMSPRYAIYILYWWRFQKFEASHAMLLWRSINIFFSVYSIRFKITKTWHSWTSLFKTQKQKGNNRSLWAELRWMVPDTSTCSLALGPRRCLAALAEPSVDGDATRSLLAAHKAIRIKRQRYTLVSHGARGRK